MREFNLLDEYPKLDKPRFVSDEKRTIKNRIIASERNYDFFDGERDNGYGGFKYDGRWEKVANKIYNEYKLNEKSSLLQLNSEKGFLISDFKKNFPDIKCIGLETSDYAIDNSIPEIKKNINKVDNYIKLNFLNDTFDFVLAIGVIYALTITDLLKCIKEIQRVGNGKSFITLASYTDEKDYWLFKNWTLIGALILKKEEWVDVLKYANYTGDYYFTNAQTLNLQADNL